MIITMTKTTATSTAQKIIQEKVVKSFEEITGGVNSGAFKLSFKDGDFIVFHGGSVGYENAQPWFELYTHDTEEKA